MLKVRNKLNSSNSNFHFACVGSEVTLNPKGKSHFKNQDKQKEILKSLKFKERFKSYNRSPTKEKSLFSLDNEENRSNDAEDKKIISK